MLNPYLLRSELFLTAKKLLRKGYKLDTAAISIMENQRKALQIKTENLQSKHNILSNMIRDNKVVYKNNTILKNQIIQLDKDLNICKGKLNVLQEKIYNFSMSIPNIPGDDLPEGNKSIDNQIIKYWGRKKKYNFEIQDHIEIGKKFNNLDWKSSANMSGTRFVIMKGHIALLHRALSQFMLDLHTLDHGYIETYVPYLVHPKALYGTGQLPKFSDDLFHIHFENKNNYILIPTAEVPLTNLVNNQIIDENNLPIMLTAHTPCFRSEASSYGKDVKGLIRLHQFDKVELVQIVKPEHSQEALENITHHAEKVLQLLDLPYRKILLCSGKTGFSASKTYDLEVWFPSQEKYREISSCSNMNDFQARRMKARYRDKSQKK